MITITHSGNFNNTEKFFNNITLRKYLGVLNDYGKKGVDALASATPIDSGETAKSWGYQITRTKNGISLTWTNSHIVNEVPIAIIIQYGHGTRNGGYVQGRDYINPAIRPIFDRIMMDMWKGVTS